jgi:hypothetical protein
MSPCVTAHYDARELLVFGAELCSLIEQKKRYEAGRCVVTMEYRVSGGRVSDSYDGSGLKYRLW